jgi:hypothetical protein
LQLTACKAQVKKPILVQIIHRRVQLTSSGNCDELPALPASHRLPRRNTNTVADAKPFDFH